MKNKLLVVVALVATVMFTSCKPKLSEETKKSIADFKTEWTKMSGDMAAWGENMNTSMNSIADAHKKMGEAMGDTAKLKKDQKAKLKESMATCAANGEKMNGMKKMYDDYKKGVDTTTSAFNDWSAKVDKQEVTEEQAKTAMENYNKALADGKAKMGEWDGALKGLMADEQKNHEDCMAVCMPPKKEAKPAAAAKGGAKPAAKPAPKK